MLYYTLRRPCSDFMDMLRRLINCCTVLLLLLLLCIFTSAGVSLPAQVCHYLYRYVIVASTGVLLSAQVCHYLYRCVITCAYVSLAAQCVITCTGVFVLLPAWVCYYLETHE